MFFRQILSAVHYCHQNSVIHRDLKPENMLLDSNKNIKLIDFGFGNTYHSDTQLETYCGSPFYAAPEMIKGQPYCGPEVDVWSLGVIMFALLAGRLPFESPVIRDLYDEIGKGHYDTPSHFSPLAKQLIKRMLTVDPARRATMEEILAHE
jgi:serine/threonine protein kinase